MVKVRFAIESTHEMDKWAEYETHSEELDAITRIVELVELNPKVRFRYFKEYYWDWSR